MNLAGLDMRLVEDTRDDRDPAQHAPRREKPANHILTFVVRLGEKTLGRISAWLRSARTSLGRSILDFFLQLLPSDSVPRGHGCLGSPRLRGMLLRVAAANAALMLCFETVKQLLLPHATLWLSHFITICFTTILSVSAAYAVGHVLLKLGQEQVLQMNATEGEIRKLNEELEHRVRERTAQLEEAAQELEAFSYSISHDLRAPLRHISGFSRLLVEEFGQTLAPEARRYVERIQAGTRKMGLLVDELLDLAQVGRHALNRQPTRLNEMVAEVVAILRTNCGGRQVEWVIADLPEVECDPVGVKQVLQNLLSNALKFTRPRSRAVIEISHRQENGQTVILVRDNGVGFNMKYKDKLFGVFQRLHRAEDFEGMGIGLAMVQRIVHKHGGRVWAEAELDKGATFCFTLGGTESTQVKAKEIKPDEAKPTEVTASEVENKFAAAGAQV